VRLNKTKLTAATDDRQVEGPYRRVRLNAWLGVRHTLADMLDIGWQPDPRMHALLVDGTTRWREARIGESPNRDNNQLRFALCCVMDSCATNGAEVIGNLGAGIADPNKRLRGAANFNALHGEASLRTKDTASSALTRKAMAHGDANWIARRLHGQLTAATGSCASEHCHVIVLS
jgi:hypothetical protein